LLDERFVVTPLSFEQEGNPRRLGRDVSHDQDLRLEAVGGNSVSPTQRILAFCQRWRRCRFLDFRQAMAFENDKL
jgi:hypothetical protein